MQQTLEQLYQGKNLNKNQSEMLLYNIITKKLSPIQITAALISMKIKGETIPEIIGAVNMLLKHSEYFPRPKDLFADIAGTGGDGSNTINISTASAIVASTCNIKIIKHGNRSASGLIGSMDLLQKNHLNIKHNIYQDRKNFDTLGICFLYAPQYHKTLKYVTPIRKQLKTPTLFNIIGPLINPARPVLTLIGVYKKQLLSPMIQILKILKYKRAVVVHCGGIDEVGLHDITYVAELNNENIYHYMLTASDFGLPPQPVEQLYCQSLEQSSIYMINLLKGKGKPAHTFVVAANVALLLKLFGYNNLRTNVQLVLDKIHQGTPYTCLKNLTNIRK